MKFEPPKDCTCSWLTYNRGKDFKWFPDEGCPVHMKGQQQIDLPEEECNCPSYYAGKEAAPLADFCPVHGTEE